MSFLLFIAALAWVVGVLWPLLGSAWRVWRRRPLPPPTWTRRCRQCRNLYDLGRSTANIYPSNYCSAECEFKALARGSRG